MDQAERYALVARGTQEIVKEDELETILKKKTPTAYIGYAPTGRLHIGHLIPLYKIRDFIEAGFTFTFLIADLHAYLDDEKTPWKLLDARYEYYRIAITAALQALGVDTKRVSFVKGSDFQLKKDYILNIYRMVGDVTLHRAKRAASEVVRFKDDPKLGGFIYPLLQIEDVKALDVDVAFGGIDQRGIYMLGRELLDKFKRPKYACVFTPLLPGLTGEKMSASDAASRIDLADDEKTLLKKFNKSYCPEGEVKDNGVLAFAEHLLMRYLEDRGEALTIERPEKFGGTVSFKTYKELEHAFVKKELHPADLKRGIAVRLNRLLVPVQKTLAKHALLIAKAYPKG